MKTDNTTQLIRPDRTVDSHPDSTHVWTHISCTPRMESRFITCVLAQTRTAPLWRLSAQHLHPHTDKQQRTHTEASRLVSHHPHRPAALGELLPENKPLGVRWRSSLLLITATTATAQTTLMLRGSSTHSSALSQLVTETSQASRQNTTLKLRVARSGPL